MLKIINDITGKMSALDRYSQTRLVNPESVLEHTGWVCICSYFLTRQLINVGEIISLAEVMSKAALHDMEEIVTGDVSAPTKYANPRILGEMKALEREAAASIFAKLPDFEHNYNVIWSKAKKGKEGLIICIADKLAVVYKAHQEIHLFGNLMMKDNINELLPAVEGLHRLIDESDITYKRVLYNIVEEAEEICNQMI